MLWVYVITVVSPNSEATFYNIPVVVQGEPMLESYGLMNVTENIPTVTLKLSGNRSDLNKVNSSNITVVVDLSKVYEAGTANLRYSISYPGDVPAGALNEESRYPGTIAIEVEHRIKKDVPVNIRYVGELSEDFIVDKENKILDYSTVTVSGPESVIDQITQAIISAARLAIKPRISSSALIARSSPEGSAVPPVLPCSVRCDTERWQRQSDCRRRAGPETGGFEMPGNPVG